MQPYTACNFNRVIAALPPDRRPTDSSRTKIFKIRLEALLDIYFFKLPPTLASSEFGVFSEKVNRRRSKGGDQDTSVWTL